MKRNRYLIFLLPSFIIIFVLFYIQIGLAFGFVSKNIGEGSLFFGVIFFILMLLQAILLIPAYLSYKKIEDIPMEEKMDFIRQHEDIFFREKGFFDKIKKSNEGDFVGEFFKRERALKMSGITGENYIIFNRYYSFTESFGMFIRLKRLLLHYLYFRPLIDAIVSFHNNLIAFFMKCYI